MKAKKIKGLDCDANAIEAIKLVLKTRFSEIIEIKNKADDWLDVETIHDLRVALRRLRSALRDFSPFLQKKQISDFLNRLKETAKALGVLRDQDVALESLTAAAGDAPPEAAGYLKTLIDERRQKRGQKKKEFNKAVTDQTFDDLSRQFAEDLEKAADVSKQNLKNISAFADIITFQQAGRAIIENRLREMLDLSTSFDKPYQSERLHRLRIAAKRLRYALELFASCWKGSILPFAKEISRLQTSLGDLHDSDFWIEELDKRLSLQENADSDEKCALIWLSKHFSKQRERAFRSSLRRWKKWETKEFFEHLRAEIQNGKT